MKTLVALDIINPFTKEIKKEGLQELINRINDYNCYDKVGHWFYDIEEDIDDISNPDVILEWLNHLDSLKSTKKVIGFQLDFSN